MLKAQLKGEPGRGDDAIFPRSYAFCFASNENAPLTDKFVRDDACKKWFQV